jgi:hypothetical protein
VINETEVRELSDRIFGPPVALPEPERERAAA